MSSLNTINRVNQNVLRCGHSHFYKLCQSLRHGNSVEFAVFEMWEKNLQSLKMWETLLPCLMSGLESDEQDESQPKNDHLHPPENFVIRKEIHTLHEWRPSASLSLLDEGLPLSHRGNQPPIKWHSHQPEINNDNLYISSSPIGPTL